MTEQAGRPTPEQYTPPLSLWGVLWRYLVMLVVSVGAWVEGIDSVLEVSPALVWLDVMLGLASFVLIRFRRRWPMTVAVAVTLMVSVSALASGPSALAAVSLATRRRLWQIAVVGVLGVASSQAYSEIVPQAEGTGPWWFVLSFGVVVTLILLVWGMYVGSRRELLWSLRERIEQAEQRQELRIDQARSAERERIAREMHDVLAHRISLVTMHAGALAYRDDLPPEQVRETAALIQQKSHEALTDLRAVLGMLRGREEGDRPQPTIAELPALIEEARASGMVITLDAPLAESTVLPEQIGRTVFRIVQEGLTNARKHAPDAHVFVTVTGTRSEALTVVVRNGRSLRTLRTPGAGLGLAGLRERTELVGGRLRVEAGENSFVLRASLPWPA